MNEDKELEEAIEKVNKIRLNFYDKQYKKSYTDDELTDMCDSLSTILQYIKYDSIPKKKIEDELNKKKKAIKPYEEYNKESRQYWIDTGVISYCEELLEDK